MTSTRRWLLAAAVLLVALPALAADEPADEPADDAAEPAGASDSGVQFGFHGEVRFRGDFQDNYLGFDDDGVIVDPFGVYELSDTLSYWPLRARLAGEVTFNEDLMASAEFQVGTVSGLSQEERDPVFSGNSPVGLFTAMIHWGHVADTNVSMRFGRQTIALGNEFLIGDLDFYNGTSFDAYRLLWQGDNLGFDFWWAKTRETLFTTADMDIGGIRLYGKNEDKASDYAVYAYYVRDNRVSGIDRESILVLGLRMTQTEGGASRFLYNLELVWEDGRIGNPSILDDWGQPTGLTGEDIFISAWGGEGLFGYNWNIGDNDHRVYAHAYLASGDRDSGNQDDNRFRTLYQDFHPRNGRADIVQGTNLESLGLAYEGHFRDKHVAGVDLLAFRINRPVQNPTQLSAIAGDFDGLIIPATEVSGLPDTDDLGSELDLWYDYYYTDHLSFDVAFSLFFPGEAITNLTETNDPATRLTAQARLRF